MKLSVYVLMLALALAAPQAWSDYRQDIQQLGDRFDIRAIHDQVLGRGALPLHMLEANIRTWVAEQQRGD